jgi:2-polyprenyl-6-methoxyphenol hydroxylase-like FAD-dependent oxidoreductase
VRRGIGGLALANGLRKAGVSVAVYECDRHRTDWVVAEAVPSLERKMFAGFGSE